MPRTKKRNSSMKVKAPGAKKSVESMKYEIANEFGVNLGAASSSRDNGLVGGEMTKRLVERGKKGNTTSKGSSSKSRSRKKQKASSK